MLPDYVTAFCRYADWQIAPSDRYGDNDGILMAQPKASRYNRCDQHHFCESREHPRDQGFAVPVFMCDACTGTSRRSKCEGLTAPDYPLSELFYSGTHFLGVNVKWQAVSRSCREISSSVIFLSNALHQCLSFSSSLIWIPLSAGHLRLTGSQSTFKLERYRMRLKVAHSRFSSLRTSCWPLIMLDSQLDDIGRNQRKGSRLMQTTAAEAMWASMATP